MLITYHIHTSVASGELGAVDCTAIFLLVNILVPTFA